MGFLKNSLDCYVDLKEISKDDGNPYYRVFEKIPIGVAVFDCKGNCLKVNSKLCQILGYSESELLGTGFGEFIDFNEPGINSWIPDKSSQETLKLQSREKHYFKKDGNDLWLDISLFLVIDSENRPNFVVLQIEDITGQKKADISFRAFERSFDSVYNDLSEGVTVNEQVGKFLEANPAICKKLGYTREELLQKTVTELITLKSSRIFAEQVRKLYQNGQATVRVTGICKNGSHICVDLSMWLIEYKGKPAVFSIISDIKE